MLHDFQEKTPRILICGTGNFSLRILMDIASSASIPIVVIICGRNGHRLELLRSAAAGRAQVFGNDIAFQARTVDLMDSTQTAALIEEIKPDVVIQAASTQPVSVLRSEGDRWTELVKNGGYSATLVFQALISIRIAFALKRFSPQSRLVNCCYPDVVNSLIKAAGLPIFSGAGNIAILSNILQSSIPVNERHDFRMLAHYRNLRDWRCLPSERQEVPCRVWLGDGEVDAVYDRFAARLSPEPVPDVSGASIVPPVLALCSGKSWTGHISGPAGLPGGYPVRVTNGEISLNLPSGVTEKEAVDWNLQFESMNGAFVDSFGKIHYTGRLYSEISRISPRLAEGFHISEIELVWADMNELRNRLSG